MVSAVALIAGCGGSASPPIGAPGALPASTTAPARVHQASGSSTDLLYVETTKGFYVLSYPDGAKVGTLDKRPGGPITSNPNNGDILFNSGGVIYEYAHGGQQPIAQIETLYGYSEAFDYAFDPITNNIAVSEQVDTGDRSGVIAIYSTPSGTPTVYSIPNVWNPSYLGYDGAGNLFVQGRSSANGPWVFAELPKNGSSFSDVSLDKTITYMRNVQWDGTYITIASANVIYQIKVSGSAGTVVGEVTLNKGWQRLPSYWIQNGVVLGDHTSPEHGGRYLGFWNYPAGGRAFKVLKNLSAGKKEWIASQAVSIAPSR